MKEILADLDRWVEAGEPVAMATLIAVRGSAPRLPGARLILTADGKMAGSVSGGCVENDVFERALGVLETGEPTMASYGIADELAFEVGLSCGGAIDVVIERFEPDEAWRLARTSAQAGKPAALIHAFEPTSLVGRTIAVTQDRAMGAIDAAADGQLVAAARGLLEQGSSAVIEADGGIRAFAEVFAPTPHLVIVGATHAAIALTRMAKEVGFQVTVADARGLFATPERFPEADRVIRAWPDEALAQVNLDAYSYIVILSHDPKFDLPTLEIALKTEARYIGAMGSKKTHGERKETLRGMGFSDADLARIHAPIGLSIGAATPEEIAVSVLAELIQARRSAPVRATA